MSYRARGSVRLLHASLGRSLHVPWQHSPLWHRVPDTQCHLDSHPLKQHLQLPSRPFGLNKTYTLLRLVLRHFYRLIILLINNRWLLLPEILLSVRHSLLPLRRQLFAGLLLVLTPTPLAPWNSAKSYAHPLRLSRWVRL